MTNTELINAFAEAGFQPPAVTPLIDLYADYRAWSHRHNLEALSIKSFARRMAREFMPCRLPDGTLGFVGIEAKDCRSEWGSVQ